MLSTSRVLAGLLIVLFAGFLYSIHDVFEQRVVEAGDTAPKFSVTTEAGQRIGSTDFNGKLLMVNFWATWCPPCVEEMPSLNQFAKEMSPQGVVVLGVSIDRNEKAYRDFLARNRLAFQVSRDPEENISSSYGTFKWPETYVINREGKVVQKFVGPRDWTDPQIVSSIRSLL
ncbi:MAG TPA: TlpA disulfide reductase family protein [Bryobacteraceae bacterium]|nr:TlpA disulfide reductase family protein [Bryobacteraceae bacterium]